MKTMEVLRRLNKAEYSILRKKVRSNILINSEVAWSKRAVFDNHKNDAINKFVVGGVILKKRLTHSCSLYEEGKGWNHVSLNQLIENPSLMTMLQNVETRANLVLFDFSGIFTVMFSPPPMAFTFLKEGDIAYATGKISPGIYDYGQGVFGSDLFTEEEINSYIRGESFHCENLYSKDYITKVKEANSEESLVLLVDQGGSPMEITNCLLKEVSKAEGIDYFWVCSAIHDIYQRHPSDKIYNLLKKYYYRWSETQNDMEPEEKRAKDLQLIFPCKDGDVANF